MEVNCIFESNLEALRAIWANGVSLFESITPDEVSRSCTPYGFLASMRAYLCLIGDREGARSLLQNAYRRFSETDDRANLYMFPIVLEYYDTYADDHLFTGEMLRRFHGDFTRLAPSVFPVGHYALDALYLGACIALSHLQAKAGINIDISPRVKLTQEFHSTYYDCKCGQYHDENGVAAPSCQLLPLAFGFSHEGGHAAARRWLIEESFTVPRELRILLYDALLSEELFDLLMPTLLEGGVPLSRRTPADLGAIVCLVTHLCGVDLAMMGQGIQAATPHLPQGVSYLLTIPASHHYLTFESEDYPGELVY